MIIHREETMKITHFEIQERRFKLRFRGFDVREVDGFLEQVAATVKALEEDVADLKSKNHRLLEKCSDFQEREETFKQAMENTQKVLEKVNQNARTSAENMIANAEVQVEKMLNRAHNRLTQLNEDISQLRRQRMQIETQIRTIIETHTKLLDMGKSEMLAMDEEYDKVKLIKQST